MGRLVIHNDRIADREAFVRLCPFSALEIKDGEVNVNAACRMCRICIKKSKNGEAEYIEQTADDHAPVDKSLWRGICVYVDHVGGVIHPVTYELIGKARELADKTGQRVYALFIGHDLGGAAEELRYYPVDEVCVYDDIELRDFRVEPYTAAFTDFITAYKPCAILVGATTVGRQLAPRVAARVGTGLTADCTQLEIEPNTDLSQIRPAFGGNIMAHIFTPRHRPQMATVRYKIMNAPPRSGVKRGSVTVRTLAPVALRSGIEILSVTPKPPVKSIEQADIIVAAGRGVRQKSDLAMIERLADALGAELAGTRPMIESGMIEPRRQIGLSGRTVRPKLIITCGVSGAIQFCAGMNGAEHIIAINSDPEASIFRVAHTGIVGDIYEVVPRLIGLIGERKR